LNPAPAARTIHGVPDWLHGLSVFWLAAFVFGVAVLVTAAIYAVVMLLATGERGRAFASISPGLLPPMGIMFALLVGFLAAQGLEFRRARCGRRQRGGELAAGGRTAVLRVSG
jgi:membrane protein implicated in regulation of membrane protease activity